MGLKNWLIKKVMLTKRKPLKVDDLDKLILDELKEVKKTTAMREKLLKLRMAQQIKNESIEEMRRDIEGDEDAPQEMGGMEEQIGQMLISKLLGGVVGQPQPNPEAPTENFGSLEDKAKDLGITDEQIEQFKKEFPLR